MLPTCKYRLDMIPFPRFQYHLLNRQLFDKGLLHQYRSVNKKIKIAEKQPI